MRYKGNELEKIQEGIKKLIEYKKVCDCTLNDRLKKYNKQHGTHISYGEYMNMRDRVW